MLIVVADSEVTAELFSVVRLHSRGFQRDRLV